MSLATLESTCVSEVAEPVDLRLPFPPLVGGVGMGGGGMRVGK